MRTRDISRLNDLATAVDINNEDLQACMHIVLHGGKETKETWVIGALQDAKKLRADVDEFIAKANKVLRHD